MMTDTERLQLAERKLRRFITKSSSWQAVAKRLIDADYTQADGTGITPVVFEKENKDTLYLFRATIAGIDAGAYTIQITDQIEPYDPKNSILYLTQQQAPTDPKKAAYAWTVHRLVDKPDIFSVRDAADHLGVSPVTIKYATSRPGVSNPLESSLNNTTSRHLFTEEDLLLWNLRRGRGKGHGGRTPGSRHLSHKRLYDSGERNLRHKIAVLIERGDLPANSFRAIFKQVTNRDAPDSNDPDVLSAATAGRIELVTILTQVGEELEANA